MRTEYVTWVDGSEKHRGPDLELAVRAWDASTFAGPAPAGGIAVHVWDGDVMVRDGWVLHVDENGRVYLNPSVKESV